MCSQFTLRLNSLPQLALQIKKLADLSFPFGESLADRVFPYSKAPVLVEQKIDGENYFVWEMMRFGLLPSWSSDERIKFSTHNARLESVDAKASFKDAFLKRHCLVPMSAFFEAVYRGPEAGNILEFSAETNEPLMAAGIWEEWVNKKTGEIISSFSILTHDPYPDILSLGHDRSPFFLNSNFWSTWLCEKKQSADRWRQDLLQHRYSPKFLHKQDRALAKGWERKVTPTL